MEKVLPDIELIGGLQSTGVVAMTPIGPGEQPFFAETISSVVKSFDHAGVELTWIVCGGYGMEPVDDMFAAQGITVSHVDVSPVSYGGVYVIEFPFGCPASVGRNMIATSAPEGSWLVNIDADDIMAPDRIDMVNQCDSSIMYHFCAASDINPDGSIVEYPVSSGILDMGWKMDRDDIHFTTLSIRRDILLAVGGYPGVAFCEDSLLCDKLSTLPLLGKVDDSVGCFYRKGHGGNMTMQGYDSTHLFDTWR